VTWYQCYANKSATVGGDITTYGDYLHYDLWVLANGDRHMRAGQRLLSGTGTALEATVMAPSITPDAVNGTVKVYGDELSTNNGGYHEFKFVNANENVEVRYMDPDKANFEFFKQTISCVKYSY
jgi:hypothetical protein